LKDTWEDERDPLAALRAGDSRPFEAFVETELPTFLGFFQRLGASRAEAEDRVQDLFLKLYQHARTYDRQGRFVAYAFRVARNLWIDRSRRLALRESAEGGDPVEDGASLLERMPDPSLEEPGTDLARREEVDRLRRALAELGDHHRLVFELGVMEGMPYQEIGSVLDIPVGTVKSRMFHAVRKLQEMLGEESDG
jgi:RNA polymerase sigma-70 factor, ECF subfamily